MSIILRKASNVVNCNEKGYSAISASFLFRSFLIQSFPTQIISFLFGGKSFICIMEAHLLADSIHVISNRTLGYISSYIDAERTHTLTFTEGLATFAIPHLEQRVSGKVRDVLICKDVVILITTDRQSAFDRILCSIPYKGQVLNLLSKWWFTHSLNMVPNAFIASPHPNVTIAKRCDIFPVEFVIRGYITGSTATSMWTNYANGVRNYCGHNLPEGLVRNQKLAQNLLTPTTKSAEHDALTSGEEILASGVMTAEQYHTCAHYAHTLFAFGQTECQRRGLILVDTKYEFGMDRVDGTIRLVDEVHTPDSSRFWMAHSYEQRAALGLVSAYIVNCVVYTICLLCV